MQLVISLPKNSDLPVYIQVANAIQESIIRGILKPGDRLPSIRELSTSLKLARLTINRAYEHLSSQGCVSTVQGSGTFVLESALVQKRNQPTNPGSGPSYPCEPETVFSQWAHQLLLHDSLASPTPDISAELNYNAAMLQVLPLNLWRKSLFKTFDMQDPDLLSYTVDPFGYMPLREALAEYLGRARNLICSPDQIAIFCHTEAGTDKLARLLLQPGDLVGVEEPGSPGVRTTFSTHAARLLHLFVDDDGIIVDELFAYNEVPRLIYLTPSHQDFTGAALSITRREALLEWVKAKDCFIIEDDYDCEYYYGKRTLPALMSLDESGSVIYRFNFWKSLFPLVRMGFLVLPRRLVPLMRRAKMLTERDNSVLEQKALAHFLTLGYFERHISRTRTIYEKRRAAVLHAITRHCKKWVKVSPTTAGTHLISRFSAQLNEEQIITCAASSGVPLSSTRHHYAGTPVLNEFIISFAMLDEFRIDAIFAAFADCLRATSAPTDLITRRL